MNIPESKFPRVVIIGGGFGGLQAASMFRHTKIQVTLIDKRNFHLFQPLLYQVATGGLSPADIASPLRSIFKKYKNITVWQSEVTDIDIEGKIVITDEERKASASNKLYIWKFDYEYWYDELPFYEYAGINLCK